MFLGLAYRKLDQQRQEKKALPICSRTNCCAGGLDMVFLGLPSSCNGSDEVSLILAASKVSSMLSVKSFESSASFVRVSVLGVIWSVCYHRRA